MYEEARMHNVVVKPAISGDRIKIYVRHKLTNELVCDGQIHYHSEGQYSSIIGNGVRWFILPQQFLESGRMYVLGPNYFHSFNRSAEGESALILIPEVKSWVVNTVGIALSVPEAPPAQPKRTLNPLTWFFAA